MKANSETWIKIAAELERMEEDCSHSGKSQFNAGSRWSIWNYVFGIPSVILSAIAGAAFFKQYTDAAGAMSSIVTILTALMTFLKPSERAARHKKSGDQYLSLRNDARVYREIVLPNIEELDTAIAAMKGFTKRRDELNQSSPQFSDGDRRKARRSIEIGDALHIVDKREN